MIFYAVVSGEIHQVIEFYRTPAEAEAMVELVLEDEPDLEDVLWVEPVDAKGTALDDAVVLPRGRHRIRARYRRPAR